MEGCEADGDAGQGQDQRESGGDDAAEDDDEQDHGGEAAEQLGLVEGFFVGVVEVGPHRPLTGHLGAGAVGERDRLDEL